jgi:predicted TIM-barrel fold metal-dependent hydrolase
MGWASQRRREEAHRPAPLPFLPGEVSNGEFVPREATARDRAIAEEGLARASAAADRLGLDRRRFLQTAGGMAAMLGAVNLVACGGGGSSETRRTTSTTTTTRPSTTAGTFEVPEPEETEACEHALGDQGEFIFDVHTHHVMPDRPWKQNAPRILDMVRGLAPATCTEAEPIECLNRVAYLHDLFLASDTTIAMLSDVPNSGPDDAPVPFDDAVGTADFAKQLTEGGEPRVLVHNVIAPNFGPLQARLDDMAARAETGRVAAFKVYTAWGPGRQGYSMLDPAIGIPVVEQARSLGVEVLCAHKGLPLLEFDRRFNGPEDIVGLAARYPDMSFVVYHGAYDRDRYEGPYDPARADLGIDTLIKAMDDAGVPPNANLYAELGTTWRELMSEPDQAGHAVGKLLQRVGEDNVLWGTDGIWYGSPQPQIMAFRAFQISAEHQERHGYPALTDDVKRKVFGLNAARLFGVDPEATRCALDGSALEAAKVEVRSLAASGALPPPWQPRGPVTRREVLTWLSTTPYSPY